MSLALHTCAIPAVPAKLLATLGERMRVIVSGFDVSDRCFMADAEAGIAWCYRANMAGEFPISEPDGQPSIVRMFGTVVIEQVPHSGKSGAALVDEAKDDSVTMAVKAKCRRPGLREKFARALRKWADLIDPRTGPRNPQVFTVKLECDTRDFDNGVARMTERLNALVALGQKAGVR